MALLAVLSTLLFWPQSKNILSQNRLICLPIQYRLWPVFVEGQYRGGWLAGYLTDGQLYRSHAHTPTHYPHSQLYKHTVNYVVC